MQQSIAVVNFPRPKGKMQKVGYAARFVAQLCALA